MFRALFCFFTFKGLLGVFFTNFHEFVLLFRDKITQYLIYSLEVSHR
jgi:hypothetical protein